MKKKISHQNIDYLCVVNILNFEIKIYFVFRFSYLEFIFPFPPLTFHNNPSLQHSGIPFFYIIIDFIIY